MKHQELHLLNRIYIHPPDKKILPYFGDYEDVISPDKILATLNKLDKMKYDKTGENAMLQLHLPKKYSDDIYRHTIYVMTKNIDMFQTLRDLNYQDEEAVFDWLIHYWKIPFLMTFPIYFYKTLPCTFHLKNNNFTLASNNYHYLVERGLHSIGNGVTLLLSLNAIGKISNEIIWNVFHRFLENMDVEWIYELPYQWIQYHNPQYMHILDFPFLYAFQYCDPMIYELLYYHPNTKTVCFLNEHNENIYFSSIFTAPVNPQKHHYQFLKKTKQSWQYIQTISSNFHFNIHQRLLGILQSSSSIYKFLSNDLSRRFLIHCIYKNKRLGLLKFIQSISYLYHNSMYSKRHLKLIWRNIMNEFKEDFVKMISIYLIEYFLLESNAKSSLSLLCPPLKMFRDTMYILKDRFSLHKNLNISMIIATKYRPYLNTELFHSPQEIRSNHDKYVINMSFLQILKLIKPYNFSIQLYLRRIEKKRMTLLQCCHNKSYEVYQVMQDYYRRQPDALWKV